MTVGERDATICGLLPYLAGSLAHVLMQAGWTFVEAEATEERAVTVFREPRKHQRVRVTVEWFDA